MIVVDASVLFEVVAQTTRSGPAMARLFGTDDTIHAPHLADLEVMQVVRRSVARGELSEAWGRSALALLPSLDIERHDHVKLLPRIWALRQTLTAYDASYIALAELLDAPLVTRDGKLLRAPGHHARIELV